jgi:hypothetical protein
LPSSLGKQSVASLTTPEANARLTSLAGTVLLILLAVEGVTVLGITVLGHRLLTAHIVVGLALLGPLAVKLASTTWRFVRYYTGDSGYGRAGPPRPLLRLLAPVVVVTTVALFASGVGLLTVRPGGGSTLGFIHKVSFVLWFGAMTIHVLAYVAPAVRRSLADLGGRGPVEVLASRRPRLLLIAVSLLAGAGLGAAGLGWAHSWATWFSSKR